MLIGIFYWEGQRTAQNDRKPGLLMAKIFAFTDGKIADIRETQGKNRECSRPVCLFSIMNIQTLCISMAYGKMKISAINICLCICFLVPVLSSSSAGAREVIVSSVTGSAEEEGPNSDVLHAIADRLKVRLVLLQAPFKRRLVMMEEGEIDFMVGLLKSPEREGYIHFVEPAYKNRSDAVFFVPKNRADRITRYEDLYDLTIGTTIGARYFPRFDADEKIRKDPLPRGELNLKKLLLGRIDAVIFPEGAGIDLGYKLGISGRIEIAHFRFSRRKDVHIGISKNSTLCKELPQFEGLVRQMIVSGEIRQIYAAYYRLRGLPVPAM